MELKEFISETLVQIQEGVADAIARRSASPTSAGVINPVFGNNSDSITKMHQQQVEFDVALTVTDKISGGGKAGIKVFSVEMGANGLKSVEQSTVSHIKFTIPLIPPVQLVQLERN